MPRASSPPTRKPIAFESIGRCFVIIFMNIAFGAVFGGMRGILLGLDWLVGVTFMAGVFVGAFIGFALSPFTVLLYRRSLACPALILLIAGIAGLVAAFVLDPENPNHSIMVVMLVVVFGSLYAFVFVPPSWPRDNESGKVCPDCGYDLAGLPDTAVQCPECGGMFRRR